MLAIIHWCKIFTIFIITVQLWKYYNIKYLFYKGLYHTTIPNCEIIGIQLGEDNENGEHFTYQTISSILYMKMVWYVKGEGQGL